jgi:hypothetical protein
VFRDLNLISSEIVAVAGEPDDSCQYAPDFTCDEPTYCVIGTDLTDCTTGTGEYWSVCKLFWVN